MTDDLWKAIPDYPRYEASEQGQIRNAKTGRILTGTLTKKGGYRQVCIRHATKWKCVLVHRLVAATFLGPPPTGYVVNHLNRNPLDNRAENLEWTTPLGNARHAAAHGLLRPVRLLGEKNPGAKLTVDTVRTIRTLRGEGWSFAALGKRFGVTDRAVRLVVARQTWAHVD